MFSSIPIFKRFYLFLFREEKRVRKTSMHTLPLECPLLDFWSTTQACALTENRPRDPLVHRPALNTLNHTSQHSSICIKAAKGVKI